MHQAIGRLLEIRAIGGAITGRITCPPELLPAPGQYLLAYPQDDPEAMLAIPLFAAGFTSGPPLTVSPIPASWMPGVNLALRGPAGQGFQLPSNARRVALAITGDNPARLLPLAAHALSQDSAVTFYCGASLQDSLKQTLPAAVEIYPIESLPEALSWADFIGIDSPLERLPDLPDRLGVEPGKSLSCDVQVLVDAAMPCCGLAECGACAVRIRRGWQLACKDGPVFNWKDLVFNV